MTITPLSRREFNQKAARAGTVDAAALHISAITVPELETGILPMARRDAGQGAVLRRWSTE